MQKEKLKIELDNYSYTCGEPGCCDNYGTKVKVNGFELELHNTDSGTIVKQILSHLGYNVEVIELENGEEVCKI